MDPSFGYNTTTIRSFLIMKLGFFSNSAIAACLLAFSTATTEARLDGHSSEHLERTFPANGARKTQAIDPDSDFARHAIPGQYVVVFDAGKVTNATDKALRMIRSYGGGGGGAAADPAEIAWRYRAIFQGVTMRGVDERMLAAFESDPEVVYYEQVRVASLGCRAGEKYQSLHFVTHPSSSSTTPYISKLLPPLLCSTGHHRDSGFDHQVPSTRPSQLGIGPN